MHSRYLCLLRQIFIELMLRAIYASIYNIFCSLVNFELFPILGVHISARPMSSLKSSMKWKKFGNNFTLPIPVLFCRCWNFWRSNLSSKLPSWTCYSRRMNEVLIWMFQNILHGDISGNKNFDSRVQKCFDDMMVE